jgi:DNA modification methylase
LTTDYADFIASKRQRFQSSGIEVRECDIAGPLYPFQIHLARWALEIGRAAIFADCGLGKTIIQLEWAHQITQHTGGRVLILSPLAVSAQTEREAARFGYDGVERCETGDSSTARIVLTNYERLHHFNADEFAGVVLDESSILKSYMGKTKRALVEAFRDTRFKLCCTATPAPNDHMELGNHADFLNVMASNEMLARWFINDTMSAGKYRLKGHAKAEFWGWVASWAVSISKPSDVSAEYSDTGYVLPPLQYEDHILRADQTAIEVVDKFGQAALVRDGALSATTLHRELRLSAPDRAERVASIVALDGGSWVIWCHSNYEADELVAAIPEAIEVRGGDSMASKESALEAFSSGEARIIITKPSIAGFGLNWQHCHNVAFIGLSYSFETFYQAVRRTWRFGQESPVTVHIVRTDTEGDIARTVRRKMHSHESMRDEMERYARSTREEYELTTAIEERATGEGWELILGDSVQVTSDLESDSIGLSVFSPPFSNLYIYSDREEDLGNSADDVEFFEHFAYLIRELYRVTIPGRIAAVHCKDLPMYAGRDGAAGLRDFPGHTIAAFEAAGWTYHSRVTIWKDPVIEMQRTKNHGLLYKQLRKDSSASRQGMADYVLAFRKWEEGLGDDPVTHTHDEFPLDQWQAWASPVWDDIHQTRILRYTEGKTSDDERHICPLQLEVIERCLKLWSNPGDLVLSPFAGIGSEGYEALRWGRRFLGIELKRSYYELAQKNLRSAVESNQQEDLFA